MPLNTAGLTAILDDGNEAVIYLACGSGANFTDQNSAARVLLTSTVSGGVLTATSVPYAFTGTPVAAITHVLLFSAATGGTFYGSQPLAVAAAFNGSGNFSLTSFLLAGTSSNGTTAGVTALLDDGNEATVWVGIGSDAAGTQTSTARVPLLLAGPTAAVSAATGLPYSFTGAALASAAYAQYWTAATGGTLLGASANTGGMAFSPGGGYNLTAASVTASATPSVPTSQFTRGVNVGVPSGTSLTTRTSLGSPTSSESYTITHPVTGATNTRTYSVYRNIRFTQTITPAAGSPTTPIRFDQCEFLGQGFWNVEVNSTGRSSDIMTPLVVFTDCNFDGGAGGGLTSKCLLGGACWVIRCDMRNSEDGWSGWFYNVGIESNFLGYGATIDLHSDGVQSTDTGKSVFWRSFFQTLGPGASQAFRVGTEAGAVDDVQVYYSGLDGGGYAMQFRGDSGAGDITNVIIIGNRWTRLASFGPKDFVETTGVTWSDNAFTDGVVINYP